MAELPAITILYYESDMLMELHSLVLYNCQVGNGGRVIIPRDVKDGKLIVAVLLGEAVVLNSLGDRTESLIKSA